MQTFALDLEYNVITKGMMSTEYIYSLKKKYIPKYFRCTL